MHQGETKSRFQDSQFVRGGFAGRLKMFENVRYYSRQFGFS